MRITTGAFGFEEAYNTPRKVIPSRALNSTFLVFPMLKLTGSFVDSFRLNLDKQSRNKKWCVWGTKAEAQLVPLSEPDTEELEGLVMSMCVYPDTYFYDKVIREF